ncbi:unnamed protein product [Trichobilharzia regenti]|nr:unnamed protein product [Trichobilharzia regenti]
MRKVLERDAKLSQLDDRAGQLSRLIAAFLYVLSHSKTMASL